MLFYYITDRNAFPGTQAEKRVRLLAKIAEAAQCGVDFIQLREKDLTSRELERLAREAVQVVRDHTLLENSSVNTRVLINSRTDIALAVGADGVHLTATDISASDVRKIVADSQRLTSAAKAAVIDQADGTAKAVPFPNKAVLSPNTKAVLSKNTKAALFPNTRAVPFPNIDSGDANQRVDVRDVTNFVVGVSCHTGDELCKAASDGASFAVFAPVFEKSVSHANAVAGTSQNQARQLVSQRPREEGLAVLKAACNAVVDSSMPILALGGITLENAPDCVAAGVAGIAAIRLFQDNSIAEVVERLRTSK